MLRKRTIAVLTGATVVMALIPWRAEADQVILDDLIVDGSICAGLDCVNGESFGFDTLRLKENNLRIKAQDTSSSASFPTNDWQITFNDSSNGGANKFAIDDIDGGRTPFTITAGARANSIFVSSSGRVGLGTAVPVVDLHVVSGNTPTLRLQQDGSSGFTPQTWDLSGNEANFFIRDATNGSTLPFRIRPGAVTDAIDIKAGTQGHSNIGMGTATPAGDLHIRDTGSSGAPDHADLYLEANGIQWRLRVNHSTGEVLWTDIATGNNVFRINDGANQDLLRLGDSAADRVDITGRLFLNGVEVIAP